MKRIILGAAAFAALSSTAIAQAPAPDDSLVPVAIETSAGRIVVALDKAHAPLTTANFLSYVDAHKYDGETFYRAMPKEQAGLIQGGIRDARKLSKPVPYEGSDTTGVRNTAGAIAMAASAPGKAQSDFFIETRDIPGFDGPDGFAAFGHVVQGMDVVEKILAAPVSPTKGEGAMKGQMLEPPIKIIKMERVKD